MSGSPPTNLPTDAVGPAHIVPDGLPTEPPVLDADPPLQGAEPPSVTASDVLKPLDPTAELPSVADLERRSVIKRVGVTLGVVVGLIGMGAGALALVNTYLIQERPAVGEVNGSESPGTISPTQDTDADGMPDVWELKFGLAVDDASDATRDPDIDRLRNLDEYRLGSDPLNEDTDGDGFADGREVENGHSPIGEGPLQGVTITSGGQAVTNGSSSGSQNPFSGSSGSSAADLNASSQRNGLEGVWSGAFRGATVQSDQAILTINRSGNVVALFDVRVGSTLYELDAEGPLRTLSSGSIQGTVSGVLLRGSQIEPVTWQLELRLDETSTTLQGSWTLSTRSGEPFVSDVGTIRLSIPEPEQTE